MLLKLTKKAPQSVNFLLKGAVVLVLVLLLALISLHRLWLPQTSGEVEVAGPSSTIRIRFDELQRPFVQAESFEDVLFAQGWLHASNRLWQMELFRRAGSARLAQMLGDSMLEADRELWQVGVPELAGRLRRQASPEFLAQIGSYVAGINAALEAQTIPPMEFLLLGEEVETWTVEDVFAVGALTAYQSANNFRRELLRLALLEEVGEDAFGIFLVDGSEAPDFPLVVPRSEQLLAAIDRTAATDPVDNPLMPRLAFGSNGWVVAPQKSATGKALFAFDSHDALGLPNLFYEVHLFYRNEQGDERQVRGWSAAGLPGVINGFNERIAWGFTNIGDTQDLFLEQYCADGERLQDGDECYLPEAREVAIPRQDGASETFTITLTRNGRLISAEPPIALRWTVHELETLSLESLFDFNRARSWEEFTTALDSFPAPTLNATYADVDGNIGFRTAGALPLRGRGDGLYPLPGNDPANRWQGLVPAENMPERANPEEGFLASANARVNAPGQGTLVSADNASPYRIARIQQVLGNADKLTLDDMRALQMDWQDGQAAMHLGDMIAQVDASLLGNTALTALNLLQQWQDNPVASPDSAAALIYQRWYPALARTVFSRGMSEELLTRLMKGGYVLDHALDRLLQVTDDPLWWRGDKGQLLAMALQAAVTELQTETGESDPKQWQLRDLHQVGLRHEISAGAPFLAPLLDAAPEGWAGSVTTVGRAGYRYDKPNRVSSAATVRVVAEMSDPIRAAAVIPSGQSGYPLSPHYADQFPLWLQGVVTPLATAANAVSGEELVLRPAVR